MLTDIGFKVAQVLLNIIQDLIKPRLPMFIGSLKGNDAEGADTKQPVALQGLGEAGPELLVGNDDA